MLRNFFSKIFVFSVALCTFLSWSQPKHGGLLRRQNRQKIEAVETEEEGESRGLLSFFTPSGRSRGGNHPRAQTNREKEREAIPGNWRQKSFLSYVSGFDGVYTYGFDTDSNSSKDCSSFVDQMIENKCHKLTNVRLCTGNAREYLGPSKPASQCQPGDIVSGSGHMGFFWNHSQPFLGLTTHSKVVPHSKGGYVCYENPCL